MDLIKKKGKKERNCWWGSQRHQTSEGLRVIFISAPFRATFGRVPKGCEKVSDGKNTSNMQNNQMGEKLFGWKTSSHSAPQPRYLFSTKSSNELADSP